MSVSIGDQAPDFELKDQTGQPVRLSDYRGKKNVLLVFHPLSFTGICEGEMCAIRDEPAAFNNDEVATISVSCDPPPTRKKWAAEQGFDFPLLSDFWPHGAVAKDYGVFNEDRGVAVRATFLIDTDGRIVFTERNDIPEARDADAWRSALRDLGVSGA